MLKLKPLLIVVCLICSGAHGAVSQEAKTSPAQQLFDLLNQEREKAGLKKYEWDEHLTQAAAIHAKLLAERHELSHQFDGEAAVPERLKVTGARFTASAENVATANSVDEAHMALMASPGHKANIMSTRYNAAGIGIAESNGHLYITQDFAWVMPVYTEAQFRDALGAAVNRTRKGKGLPALEVHPDMRLQGIACSTKGDAQPIVAGMADETAAVMFTSSDPEKLPEQLDQYLGSARLRRMNVGVCFRPDPRYGYANFWVAVAFGG